MQSESQEKKDIKNIIELIEGFEAVGVPVAKALADGKLNEADLPHLLSLVKEHEKIIAAVADIGEVVPEAKDIDSVEAIQAVQKLIEVAKKIKEASKA